MNRQLLLLNVVAATTLLMHPSANAINGAQLGGNGVMNASMGGASIALPLDAGAAANNPAGMAYVPTSYAIDLQIFNGVSSADFAGIPGNHLNNKQTIPAPQGGVNWQYSPSIALGVSVSGSGSGSDYGQTAAPSSLVVGSAGNAKTSLRNAEIIPTIAWKVNDGLALGFSLNLARQRFMADGVVVPTGANPPFAAVPSHGTQSATGIGWRAGVMWKPNADLTLGANFKARTKMGNLSGYENDLLAFSKSIDLPEEYGIGVAWKATPNVIIAGDWLRVKLGDIKVMQDPNGFGWRSQPIKRLGVAWAMNDQWTLRAGLSRNTGQIDSARAAQNLLVPSVHEKAYTAGLTWAIDRESAVSAGYEINPQTTLTGTGDSTGTNLTSKVQIFMLGWQRRF